MAVVPLPRPELSGPSDRRGGGEPAGGRTSRAAPGTASAAPVDSTSHAARAIERAIPPTVRPLLERLWGADHDAYVVGGSLRDVVLGRSAHDWDLATSARPDEIQALFAGARYENRFGTVGVADSTGGMHEVTTFRSEHEYADHRRPHHVEFGDSIAADLARRDFTVNALAWGRNRDTDRPGLLDPYGGVTDARDRWLRTVGDPNVRFEEDALRMLRAVRFVAALELRLDPATRTAIAANARLAGHLSGERIAAELLRLLQAPEPSVGLRLMAETRLLAAVLPELEAARGVRQNKVPGEDLWDHIVRTVDAAPAGDPPIVRLAALLHDVGKPVTAADGHFHGHEAVGAEIATSVLTRLHLPRHEIDEVARLVRFHMFGYHASWGEGAVRRFVAKVGVDSVRDLLALRAADNVGSGLAADAGRLEELSERIERALMEPIVRDRRALAVDGRVLMDELAFAPGPALGRVLDRLVERVLAEPSLNERATLLRLARAMKANAERIEAERRAARARRPLEPSTAADGTPVGAGSPE